ncbi:arabinogalactan endo-1,4-beta-galactosidase [Agromyces flavus]|uniref:Arabinogalactan endo-beta-1,4-galactanase n=1 Tax=Agromyces flavus TaxID=589382 RepID=A0A1H2A2V0_9MICO|nr:glycosyl hydrolase 53 family protein [Agromyces flavus]MCP2367399.1 arabinogalactan endo-1,4-beta-galactosidase [Agromyces flavus]GGI45802.1 arabinogalactan endo-beta-1,4-galactanase [Agromyces flavus]SDT40217.1 endo-1,4-beta-galactanase [Agromyces flavus]
MAIRRRTGRAGSVALAAALATAVAVPTGAGAAMAVEPGDGPVEAGIFVNKVEGLSPDFISGVDVSTVLSLEESGVVFRDASGAPSDLFAVLADHGVNSVRVRVWNDPFDETGRGYGGGNVGVDRAVEIGERATAAGLGVLVDFHYSDFWADPARQLAPKAWAGLSAADTATALHDYTVDALQRFEDAGVDVDTVQVGNETNNGIAGYARPGREIDAPFAALLQAGTSAVREVLPDAKVAVHFTNPETSGRYATYAAGLAQFGVDYDVFASSYYPYWHGMTGNLTAVLSQIATTYGKEVMVAETSWAHTLDDGDGYSNVIGSGTIGDAYPASVQGQATELRDVIAAVTAVGDAGIGVYYWEPAWLPVGPPSELEQNRGLWEQFGSGWATSAASDYDPVHVGEWYGGSAWDNQSLFAWDGTPLESLRTFEYVHTGAVAPLEVVSVEQPSLSVTDGAPVTLPATIDVTWNDGTVEPQSVTWSGAVDWIRGPGSYSIPGRTSEGLEVVATVTVLAENLARNGSFESADLSAWALTGPAARTQTGDAADGSYAVTFWSGTAYTASATQTLTGVPAGTYQLQATTQGTGSPAGDSRMLTATTSAGSASAPLSFTAWNEFHTATVPVTVGADGVVEISAEFALSAGAWGVFDDVRLVAVTGAEPVDTSRLANALDVAASVDRSLYTDASVAALDEAVAVGEVVLAGSRATAADVKEATKLVEKAVGKLKRLK